MTAMFEDMHHNLKGSMAAQRIAGTMFDEVAYADDAIYIGTDTRQMNTRLA